MQFSGQKGPLGSGGKKRLPGGPEFPGRQGVGFHTSKVDSSRLLNTYTCQALALDMHHLLYKQGN